MKNNNKTNLKRIILACLIFSIIIFTAFKFSAFPLRSYQLREAAVEKVLSENSNIKRNNIIIENHQRKNGVAIFAGRINTEEPKLFLVAFESFWVSPFYSKSYYKDDKSNVSLNVMSKPLDYYLNYSENSDNLIGVRKKFNPKYMVLPLIFIAIMIRFISLKKLPE